MKNAVELVFRLTVGEAKLVIINYVCRYINSLYYVFVAFNKLSC